MRSTAKLLAAAALVLTTAYAFPDEDEVKSLPGWDGPLPSRMWAGYVSVGVKKDRHLHYIAVESQSNPDKDPVTMWSNGGPGSDSAIGWLTELGTFQLDERSLEQNTTDVPKLFLNPNAWSTISNMVLFSHPAPVGYSYCDTQEDCYSNDQRAGEDLRDALQGVMDKFQEWRGRDLYLTGESYGGIYLPQTVISIEARPSPDLNLKGFAVGDGCNGNTVGTCSPQGTRINADFFYKKGFYTVQLREKLLKACPDFENPSSDCAAALNEMQDQIGNDVYVYNYVDECPENHNNGQKGLGARVGDMFARDPATGALVHPLWHTHRLADASAEHQATGQFGYYCGGENAMGLWLGNDEVATALHANLDRPRQHFNYTRTQPNLLPYYPKWAQKYRIFAYSGQFDACVPYVDTESWVYDLGLEEHKPYRPWDAKINGIMQPAGHAASFAAGNFTYVTHTAAGHMVPQFTPESALEMFRKLITGDNF